MSKIEEIERLRRVADSFERLGKLLNLTDDSEYMRLIAEQRKALQEREDWINAMKAIAESLQLTRDVSVVGCSNPTCFCTGACQK